MNGKLSRTLVYEYAQALQVLDLSKSEALSPYVASLMAFVYYRSDKKDCLEDIHEWLFNYITPYLYSDPRDQSDLREKTLAISAYYLIDDPNNQKYSLPREFLNKHLEYACKQDWYGDSFLAFITGLLADKHTIYANALDYFKRKYKDFLDQQDIQTISQALFLLPGLEESLRESGLNLIRTPLENPNAQTYEKAWGLIGISTSDNESDLDVQLKLKNSLYNEIAEITKKYYSMLVPPSLKSSLAQSNTAIRASNLHADEITEYGDSEETLSFQSSHIDVAELCLITFSILLSNTFFNLSIDGVPEKQIIEFLNHENKSSKGFIQITKSANIIGNFLAILITLMAGALAGVYLFGLQIVNGHILSTSMPALSDLLILPIWADYLLSQFQAISRGESALEGMKEIPVVRHIIHFRKKKDIE